MAALNNSIRYINALTFSRFISFKNINFPQMTTITREKLHGNWRENGAERGTLYVQ